jgi:2,5-diamino-6-(ribosylamino)-4(3H)-pyrimidinone 5'-phosphate reductase
MFLGEVPPETEADRVRPEVRADDARPVWVIPDTRGVLDGRLHVLRNSEHAQDPVILLSEATPDRYRAYLRQREYRHHVVGEARADLPQALELLVSRYGVTTLLVDSGPTLAAVLLDQGLVDEISLIIVPALVGDGSLRLFDSLRGQIGLALGHQEQVAPEVLWVRYRVEGGGLGS